VAFQISLWGQGSDPDKIEIPCSRIWGYSLDFFFFLMGLVDVSCGEWPLEE